MKGEQTIKPELNHPTRWSGKRSIDHIYSNNNRNIEEAALDSEEKVADHKAIHAKMIITGEYKRGVTKLKKTIDYRRPETVGVDEWKKLEQTWGRVDKTKKRNT